MTLNQFIGKYSGKKIDFDGAYQGQCVDLYRQYVKEVLNLAQSPGVKGASEIFATASVQLYDKILNTPTEIPQKGDIVIWNSKAGGGFGHVAVFIEGDTNRFKSFDQNWRALNVCEITEHNYTNVQGWLHPKGTMSTISVDTATYEMLVTKASKLDEIEKTGYVTKPEHDRKVSEMDSAIAILQKRISDHKCPTEQTVDTNLWQLNGMQVQEGNKTFNYKLK